MSDSERTIIPARRFGAGDAQFATGGKLTKAEARDLEANRADHLRQSYAIERKRLVTDMALQATGEMYQCANDTYIGATGEMLSTAKQVTDPVQASFVMPFTEDQCISLQSDLKGILYVGVNGIGSEVSRSTYTEAGPESRKKFLGIL